MNKLDIFRLGVLQFSVDIDETTEYTKKIMGDHVISSRFYSSTVLDFHIGDYIIYDSEYYYLNRLPDFLEVNSETFQYDVFFTGEVHELEKKLFISSDGLSDFSYTGTANDFVGQVVTNMNILTSGWTIGTVASTEVKTLEFSNEYCRGALTRIAEQFKLEYDIAGKSISLVNSVGQSKNYTFEYGKGKGLYYLKRVQVRDQNIITKLYGFGGTKNIPSNYRGRAKKLVFESRYLTKNTDVYGIIEGQYTNDDIYPQRTSTLTGAVINFNAGSGTDFNHSTSYVEDTTIDFDLNSYLIEGKTAKIVFKSGDLANVECEIWKYNHSIKRIYFNANSETDGFTSPSYNGGATIEPRTGDSYTLVDISMPQSYIDTSETLLQSNAQAYLDKNSVPQVVYECPIDQKYARTNNISVIAGDKVTIVDTPLGINNEIRISEVKFPLTNPFKLSLAIADFVPYTVQERVKQVAVTAKKEAVYVDRRNSELIRRNTVRQKQLQDLIFDQDEYFDSDRIKPLSVETLHLSVGAKSGSFGLNGVIIEPNHAGDANSLYVSAGSLIHYTLDIGGGYEWLINNAYEISGLTSNLAYYLYAKCSKSTLAGEWELTSSKLLADGDDGYYHFLVGILYAVYNSARDYDFTYGMTYINGRTITTGRIRSIDGLNYFDLDQNKFMIGDSNHSLDWNVSNPGTLTLKGAMVQSPSGANAYLPVFRGEYSNTATYYYGEQVTYNNSLWVYKYPTATSGHVPIEGAYWTLYVTTGQAGKDGISIVWKGSFASTTDLQTACGTPIAGWAYRNTTSKTTYVFNGTTWQVMSYDGQDGQSGTVMSFKGEYATVEALIAANGQPSTGWTYKNTTLKATFIYQDSTWYQMNIDGLKGDTGGAGQNGLDITWHGDASSPDPSWQSLNHTYRDTDNGIVYIWNGAGWEIMVKDGSDGVNGANGTNGMNVYITYHDNPVTSQPATPTGDGTTGNWHTDSTSAVNWMSQKVSTDASSGTWGTPICIAGTDGTNGIDGVDGTDGTNGSDGTSAYLHIAWANDELGTNFSTISASGRAYMGTYTDSNPTGSQTYSDYNWILVKGADGANGPMLSFRGTFSALTSYQNNSYVRSVVKYGDTYYMYNGSDGASGAWNGANWTSFGGNFSSVATELLLAEMSTIGNLFTQYFHSIAVPVGDLTGTVETIQANVPVALSQIDRVTKNSTAGDCMVTFGGHVVTMTWQGTGTQTVTNFVNVYAGLFSGWNITLADLGSGLCQFTGPAGTPLAAATITNGYGSAWTEQTGKPVTAQIDRVTLSGTSGSATLDACNIEKTITWTDGTLPNTLSSFVDAYEGVYLAGGGIITSVDDQLFIESSTAGVALPTTTCVNLPNPYRGAIKMQGNEIWENEEANSTYGSIVINRRGYKGGDAYYRDVLIGDGKGNILMAIYGNDTGGSARMYPVRITMDNLPTSATGASVGELYKSAGYIRYKT